VSLFIDPDPDAIKMAHRMGAQAVEIHIGRYADASRAGDAERELQRISEAVMFAHKLKLGVHAGHGINYHNIAALRAILWPADRENALGWNDAGKTGAKQECLDYIKEVWTDMRPLSLRKKMEEAANR
jgi:uncharacterized protein YbdZ (MbtH family)